MIKNIKSITAKMIIYEIILKASLILLGIPLLMDSFNNLLTQSGFEYLTKENFKDFIFSQNTIIYFIIVGLILLLFIVFNMSSSIIMKDMANRGETINIKKIVKLSLIKTIKSILPQNIILYLYLIILLPLLLSPILIAAILNLPLNILNNGFIVNNLLVINTSIIAYLLFILILIRWIFAFNYYVIENTNFIKAMKSSKNIIKKNKIKYFLKIFFNQVFIFISYIFIIMIEGILIIFINKITNNTISIGDIPNIIIKYNFITFIIYALLCIPFNTYYICNLFFKIKEKKDEALIINNYNSKLSWLKSAICTIIIIPLFLYGLKLFSNIDTSRIKLLSNVEITAHRGASNRYVENTMPAFKEAAKLNADWVELDVKQTKDRKIVVIHDGNLRRLAGLNKSIIGNNYDYLSKINIGNSLNRKNKNDKIPLFEDVVIWAKTNNVRLNIELKPIGGEVNFEQDVMNIVRKYDYQYDCALASKNYGVLMNIRKMDPKVKTIYVMGYALGNIANYYDADYFSVDSRFITERMVRNIHNNGKEIFAWTIDTKAEIEAMLKLNVDNIITNDILTAQDTLSGRDDNLNKLYINDLIKKFNKKN